jgi:hypothetical protein
LHSGIIDVGYGSTVVFRDPDNVQLEFFVHPNPADMTLTDADSQNIFETSGNVTCMS